MVDLVIEIIVNLSNIVSTAEIENIPSLEAIAIGLGLEQTEYEPEQFLCIDLHSLRSHSSFSQLAR